MKELKAAFPYTIPVLTGYVFLGITYGILMVTSGFPFWLPILTALIIYTGSMEFLTVDILLSSFHPLSAMVTAIMVGARHLFYGLSMLEKYKGTGKNKFYLIYTTSDETFAVNYATPVPEGCDKSRFYTWVSFLDQMYWVLGATIGGIFGSFITFNTEGLDFVMTAMFVSIFMNQVCTDLDHAKAAGKNKFAALICEYVGIGASALCLVIFGADRFIIPTMLLILALLTLLRGKLEPEVLPTEAMAEDNTAAANHQENSEIDEMGDARMKGGAK